MATQSVQQVVDYLKAHPEVAQIDTAALTRELGNIVLHQLILNVSNDGFDSPEPAPGATSSFPAAISHEPYRTAWSMLPLPVCMVVSAPRLDQQTGRRSRTMLRPR